MKRFSTIAAAIAATSLVAAPAMAAPANAASSLSVAKARASAPTAKGEKLGGAGSGAIVGILIAAGVAAIAIIAAVQNDDSDSN